MTKPLTPELERELIPWQHIADFNPEDLIVNVLPSGFPSLDHYNLLKSDRGELIIVAGRPSVGKSALCFQLAENMAEHYPVFVFSLEMDIGSIRARMAAMKSAIAANDLIRGRWVSDELFTAHSTMGGMGYYIDDRGGLNVHQITDIARTAKKTLGIKAIVVDHLSIIRRQKSHSSDAEISAITIELKTLAKELKIPVILACQLSRSNERRGHETGDYTPMLSDLRDSGAIEQDADMVLMLYRHEMYYKHERQGEVDIIITKNRNGPIGTVKMLFSRSQTRFIE